MKTELKNVLQFYIGCDLKTQTGTVKLVGVHIDDFNCVANAVVLIFPIGIKNAPLAGGFQRQKLPHNYHE